MKVSLVLRKDIERIVSIRELMDAMEDAFRAKSHG
jgi:hypothetical protein